MASIRQSPRKKNRWEVRYRDPGGRQRTRTFASRREANRFKSNIEVQIERGEWRDPQLARLTFEDWASRYFATSSHKRHSTLARDLVVTEKHLLPPLGHMPLRAITPLDIHGVVNAMNRTLKPRTVRTNYGVLRAILNAAVAADVLTTSPCRGVKLPAVERKQPHFRTIEDLKRLADALPERYSAIVYVGAILGLRWSEVAGLRVGRIDFLRKTIEVSETISEVDGKIEAADVKTKSSRRTIKVPPTVIEILARHLERFGSSEPDAYVFTTPSGQPLRASNFRERIWRPAVKAADLGGMTFHDLRHASVGFMIEAEAHIEAIKQRLGHSSIRVTSDVYGSLLPAVEDGVTARLDALLSDSRGVSVVQAERQVNEVS